MRYALGLGMQNENESSKQETIEANDCAWYADPEQWAQALAEFLDNEPTNVWVKK